MTRPDANPWQSIAQVWADAWRPPPKLAPWRWAEENVTIDNTSQFHGPYKSSLAAWTREPMEVFADDAVRQINVQCSAQSGKTQMILILLAWLIENAPGPTLWFTSTQEERKTFAKTRLWPTLETCQAVARHFPSTSKRNAKTMFEIQFLHMTLGVYAANSIASVRGKPARWLLLDEVTAWTNPAAFDEVLRRTSAWDNARTVILSTPKLWEDNVHAGYLASDRREYYVPCQKCGFFQPLVMKQLRYDTDEDTRPRGEDYDFDKLAETIRYECAACGHPHYDVGTTRRFFVDNGRWEKLNPAAPRHLVGFHWNGLLVPWRPWRELVQKWILANKAKRLGNREPLKAYVTQDLGEPYQEQAYSEEIKIPTGAFNLGDPWSDALYTFLTVDCQKDCFYCVAVSWAKGPTRGRLRWVEKVSADENAIEEIRKRLGIRPSNVFLDYGFEFPGARIARACAKFGWRMMRGTDRQGFVHPRPKKKPVTRVYSRAILIDAYLGTRHQGQRAGLVELFDWSNPAVKDITFALITGQGASFELAADTPPDFIEHVYKSEAKVQTRDKRSGKVKWAWINEASRPNHYWDALNENTVAACKAQLLGAALDETEVDDKAEPDSQKDVDKKDAAG